MKTYLNPTLGEIKAESISDSDINPELRTFLTGADYRWLVHAGDVKIPVTDEVFQNNFTRAAATV